MNTEVETAHYLVPRKKVDFSSLPDEAMINAREVCRLTACSIAVLDRRIAAGTFPKPCRIGRNRLWPWGEVRDFLRAAAACREG